MAPNALSRQGAAARPTGPWSSRLAGLVWFRSLSAGGRSYLKAASGDRTVTYAELRRAVDRWAALFDDLGVAPGAVVGLAVCDPLDFALAFVSTVASARVAAPIDPRATDGEVQAAVTRAGPRLVVADRPAPAGGGVDWLALPPGSFGLDAVPAEPVAGVPDVGALPAPAPGAGTGGHVVGGVVLSTSGTTGVPKRIFLDEGRLLHTAAAVADHHGLSVADRGFNTLPLFHINAEVVGLLATMVAGAALVLDDRFHRSGFWDVINRHGVTWVNAVPAILARVVPLRDGESVPGSVRFARSASAPLPGVVLDRFEAATGIPVVETYGMTEAASQITANPLDGERRRGSVGRPVATEVRVAAAAGQVGPVLIRGGGVITGYAGPGYADRFDGDGWLHTGDLGYLDDGYLTLVGRTDDVINCGGEKIYPREVEEVILGDSGVAAAAVIGEEHEVLGRVPVAYAVPVTTATGAVDPAGAEALVSRLVLRCEEHLSRPRRPAAYHVVRRLPEGATGKVRRHAVGLEPAIYSLRVR